MNANQFRQLIKEAIADRLKMIDEAGNKAAVMAKIAKIDEDIKLAQEIKSSIRVDELKHFVTPEKVSDVLDEITESIQELEAKKKELAEQVKDMDKAAKPKTSTKKEEPKKELEESFKQLVGKLKKKGKSNIAANKIAGSIAAKKMQGAGSGPTAKQKARLK
jgi:predicted transcriptional regulator